MTLVSLILIVIPIITAHLCFIELHYIAYFISCITINGSSFYLCNIAFWTKNRIAFQPCLLRITASYREASLIIGYQKQFVLFFYTLEFLGQNISILL